MNWTIVFWRVPVSTTCPMHCPSNAVHQLFELLNHSHMHITACDVHLASVLSTALRQVGVRSEVKASWSPNSVHG